MKTVTIFGSMKFADQMKRIALTLETIYGCNVLQCTYNTELIELSEKEKQNIVCAHLKKIDLSDAIYVVDVNGYIGESTKSEIEYAYTKNKEIIMHSNFKL